MKAMELKHCHDCGVAPGERHQPGCDTERCSFCGGQRLQCNCPDHDPYFSRWTGIWPGKAEADFLGVDLNAFAWRYAEIFFKKPRGRTHMDSMRDELRKGLRSEWVKRLTVVEQQIQVVMLDLVEQERPTAWDCGGWKEAQAYHTCTFDDGQLYANLHTARQIILGEMPGQAGLDPRPDRVAGEKERSRSRMLKDITATADKPSMTFRIVMNNGISVGSDGCVKAELEMNEGRITAIHIWPINEAPYYMRLPDQNRIARITSEVNTPVHPTATGEGAESNGDNDGE